MSQARMRPLKDGPVEVSGPLSVIDPSGGEAPAPEDPVYLCRCGQSATKPYCDGTHKKVGFRADGWVRPSSRA